MFLVHEDMDKFRSFHKMCTKIICVGRNYGAHAKELGNAIPTKPVLFLKPPSAFITEGQLIKPPPGSSNLHHELELGVVIGRSGVDIPEASAMSYVAGYCLALDMTARDLQNDAKSQGLPWCVSKGFDTSCPVSSFVPAASVPDAQRLRLQLTVNGDVRQAGTTADMIFPVANLISFISTYFTLQPGDLILTGTPEGVGPVVTGDAIHCTLRADDGGQLVDMNFSVK